ncbi:hypothetical protein EsH8_X_000201 [Colletotrichum jinshuiense]
MPNTESPEHRPDASPESPLPLHTFPPPTIVPPLRQPHTQTVIFLHGRGSSARIFAPPFLSASVCGAITGPGTFRDALPHTRFVFPTAPRSRATIYRRSIINQWYDGSGDWEETVLGHARETVKFVHALIEEEAIAVGGAYRVVLGGYSQGCAAALLCLLLWEGEPLGSVLGMCGMLPMARALEDILIDYRQTTDGDDNGVLEGGREDGIFEPTSGELQPDPFDRDGDEDAPSTNPLAQTLSVLREEIGLPPPLADAEVSLRKTPVFLGHGAEDDRVLLRYGKHASHVLRMMGCEVIFKTYDGLGHFYSKDMLEDMLEFLKSKA